VYANGSDTPSLYRFDRVFNAEAAQDEVFTETALPLVNACCQGYNAAVFAYGQTGTGKTHTMLGVDLWDIALRSSNGGANNREGDLGSRSASLSSSEGRGLIPRSMQRVFQYCAEVRACAKPNHA
jgi:kinesin family protein 18/19